MRLSPRLALPLVAATLLGVGLATTLEPAPESATLELPATLESTQSVKTPGVPGAPTLPSAPASSDALGVQVSPGELGFAATRPGETSAPVEIRLENLGGVPVSFRLEATSFDGPEPGVRLDASAVTFVLPEDGALLAPGAVAIVRATLTLPSGAETYVPAGSYAGAIRVHLEEVRA